MLKPSFYNLIVNVDGVDYIYNTVNGKISLKDQIEKDERFFYVDSSLDEFNQLLEYNAQLRKKQNFMAITFMLTSKCNFACPYCFENRNDHSLNNENISQLKEIILEYVLRHPSINSIVAFWFGGEPLLEVDLIREINNTLKEISYNQNLNYSSRLITNGYYLENIYHLFEELCLTDIQITLEGLKNTHDSRRITRDGHGSFDKIIENIQSLDKKIDLTIRINIDSGNIAEILKSCNFFKSLKISAKVRLFFYPALIEDYGGSSTHYHCATIPDVNDLGMYIKIQEQLEALDSISYIKSFCNVGFPGCFVVSSSGNMYKCWGQIEDSDGAFSHINSSLENIMTGIQYTAFAPKSKKCVKCVFFPLCMSGCAIKPFSEKHCQWLKQKAIETVKLIIRSEVPSK
ncbi:MAG: radical SAM protein [Defluviitaleaceae bacterium]|nr:radical SAM protein [Defluviitaleaceae bacterium]